MLKMMRQIAFLMTFCLALSLSPYCYAHVCENGAVVKDEHYCKYVKVFVSRRHRVDERIASRLHTTTTDETHSFALIVVNSEYKNMTGADLPPSDTDFDNLLTFFRDEQKFDEVVAMRNSEATKETLNYFLGEYFIERSQDF
jgi:hypothetical protein